MDARRRGGRGGSRRQADRHPRDGGSGHPCRRPGGRDTSGISGGRPGRPRDHRRHDASPSGVAVRRLPGADRRDRHGHRPLDARRASAAGSRPRHRDRPAVGSRRTRGGPARARGGPCRRDPHRVARSGRSGPRRGIHDGGRQPRGRHLRVEHRHRRCGDGRPVLAYTPAPSVARHDARDRRVRGLRRGVGIGRPGGDDGRGRAARPGIGSRRAGGHRPRLGRDDPPAGRSEPDHRRRVPAVVARHRRADRVGDAAHGVDRPARPRGAARLADREPRGVPGGAGGDAAGRPGLVRPARRARAARQPRGGPARGPGHGRRRPGHGRWSDRARRRPADPRDHPGRPGLGLAPDHGRDRGRGRDAPVRQRDAPGAHRGRDRPGGGRGDRGPACQPAERPQAAGSRPHGPPRHRRPRTVRVPPRRPRSAGQTRRQPVGRATLPACIAGRLARDQARGRIARRLAPGRGRRRLEPLRWPGQGHSPRRRPGRRDPRRRIAWRTSADRRRPRSGSVARRARRPDPALGPPDRCGRADASARGPRRGAAATPGALPRRPRLRARDAWTGPGLCSVAEPARDIRCPGPAEPRRRRCPGGRRDRAQGPVADPRPGPPRATRRRDRDQQRLDRVPRCRRQLPVPAGGRCRAGHRPVAPGERPAATRPPEGRAPRQQDRDDAAVRRCRAAQDRDRVRRDRQPVRASGEVDARSARGVRRAGLPDRPRRHGRGDLLARRRLRPGRGGPSGGDRGAPADARFPRGHVPVRHPGLGPRAQAGAVLDGGPSGAAGGPAGCDPDRRVPSAR